MKDMVEQALREACIHCNITPDVNYSVDWTKRIEHGHMSTNLAMVLAKPLRQSPMVIAKDIILYLESLEQFSKIELKAPGFINIFIIKQLFIDNLKAAATPNYARSDLGQGQSLNLEYVSSNPTGPLHVGHGRSAALGSALAKVLQMVGYTVHEEYYVNDAGRQIKILALSLIYRSIIAKGHKIKLPKLCYQGAYLEDFLSEFAISINAKLIDILMCEPIDDAELDDLIAKVEQQIGVSLFKDACDYVCKCVLKGITDDLQDFGVNPNWFFEQSLFADGHVDALISDLKHKGCVYESAGALWFKSTQYGDEKDRVLRRANGQMTYFAADAAYHRIKMQRFDKVIDVFGADHHGYIPRIKAVLKALDYDVANYDSKLLQFVSLIENKKQVSMSTRSGEFVTLKQLYSDVGVDVCRFFYLMRRVDQHIDFDLNLARQQSQDNPVYYVQYAHARMASILKQYNGKPTVEGVDYNNLSDACMPLLINIAQYPEILSSCAREKDVFLLVSFLQQLAANFHRYYNVAVCLHENQTIQDHRVGFLSVTKRVLQECCNLLGISCPEAM